MFNINTGTINYKGIIFRKGETLSEFLDTEIGKKAQLIIDNNGWSTYRVSLDQKNFFVFQFKNNIIEQVCIAVALEGTKEAWGFESEDVRKSTHDQTLKNQLGSPPYNFSWGKVESVNDPKSGASQIVITYSKIQPRITIT